MSTKLIDLELSPWRIAQLVSALTGLNIYYEPTYEGYFYGDDCLANQGYDTLDELIETCNLYVHQM